MEKLIDAVRGYVARAEDLCREMHVDEDLSGARAMVDRAEWEICQDDASTDICAAFLLDAYEEARCVFYAVDQETSADQGMRPSCYEELPEEVVRELGGYLASNLIGLYPEECPDIVCDLARLPGDAVDTLRSWLVRAWANGRLHAGDRLSAWSRHAKRHLYRAWKLKRELRNVRLSIGLAYHARRRGERLSFGDPDALCIRADGIVSELENLPEWIRFAPVPREGEQA